MDALVAFNGHPDNRVLGDLDPSTVSFGEDARGTVWLDLNELVNQTLTVARDWISATAELP